MNNDNVTIQKKYLCTHLSKGQYQNIIKKTKFWWQSSPYDSCLRIWMLQRNSIFRHTTMIRVQTYEKLPDSRSERQSSCSYVAPLQVLWTGTRSCPGAWLHPATEELGLVVGSGADEPDGGGGGEDGQGSSPGQREGPLQPVSVNRCI